MRFRIIIFRQLIFVSGLLSSFHIICQVENKVDYDTSFNSYLKELRQVCLSKDTFKLHQLIGNNAFTDICDKDDKSLDSLSRWDVFIHKFELDKEPDQSDFWDRFIQKSEQSFYFDSTLSSYSHPEFYFDKIGYVIGYPVRGVFLKVIETDTVNLLVGNQLSTAVSTKFIPKKIWQNSINPYNLTQINDDFYLCSENGNELGFISSKDVVLWNYHLLFDKINGHWQLVYYEYCN